MQHDQPKCLICGDPTDGYVCRTEADRTDHRLRDLIQDAGEVETTVARLARYATRGGHRAAAAPEDDPATTSVNRRMPVTAFGWTASKDRPKRGALRATALPVDLIASTRAADAFATVTRWADRVQDERGATLPLAAGHPAAVAAAFLLEHVEWMRHQRFADEAYEQLQAAAATVRRIIDAPPEQVVVGVCDCGAHLYARQGAAVVTCPDCKERWDVQESRDGLREALRGYLVTAAEAGTFLAFFGLTGDRRRSAKTVTMWALRGRITTNPDIDGQPTYRFGEVLDRATRAAQEYQVSA